MVKRTAVHGLYIKDKSLLMVRKGKYWILPGGKILDGESDEDCLIRETSEELSGTKIFVGQYYKTFKGITPHSKINLISKNYFFYPLGEIHEPSNEINRKKFISSIDIPNLELTGVSKKVLDSLLERGIIN